MSGVWGVNCTELAVHEMQGEVDRHQFVVLRYHFLIAVEYLCKICYVRHPKIAFCIFRLTLEIVRQEKIYGLFPLLQVLSYRHWYSQKQRKNAKIQLVEIIRQQIYIQFRNFPLI